MEKVLNINCIYYLVYLKGRVSKIINILLFYMSLVLVKEYGRFVVKDFVIK